MDPFVFSAESVISAAPAGYIPFYVQPTNLASGINRPHVVGAAQLAKVGGSDVTFYVLRQNPFSLQSALGFQAYVSDAWGTVANYDPSTTSYAVAAADYKEFRQVLEASKVLSCTGNDSLLGLIVDAICLDDFNWVVALSRDQTEEASIDVALQFIQQFYLETPFVQPEVPR